MTVGAAGIKIKMEFRWDEWNYDHATKHGISTREAERVVRFPNSGFPRRHRKGTWRVVGRGDGGRVIQVVYAVHADGAVYIIHAMQLTGRKRRR